MSSPQHPSTPAPHTNLDGMALNVHGFYAGLEQLFALIATSDVSGVGKPGAKG